MAHLFAIGCIALMLAAGCSSGPGTARASSTGRTPRLGDPAIVANVRSWATQYSSGNLAGALAVVRPGSPAAAFTTDEISTAPVVDLLRLTFAPLGLYTVDGVLLSDFVSDEDGKISTFDRNQIHLENLLAFGVGQAFTTQDGSVDVAATTFWYFDNDIAVVFKITNRSDRTVLLTLDRYTVDNVEFQFRWRSGLVTANMSATVWTVIAAAPPRGQLDVSLSGATPAGFQIQVPPPI